MKVLLLLFAIFSLTQLSSGFVLKNQNDYAARSYMNVLRDLSKTFGLELKNERPLNERGQISVLYYGDLNVQGTLTDRVLNKCKTQIKNLGGGSKIFIDSAVMNFDTKTCPFVASVKEETDQVGHIEKTLIDTVRQGDKCPAKLGSDVDSDVYLFSFFSPCDYGSKSCQDAIFSFAKDCKNSFGNLVLGYKQTGLIHGTNQFKEFVKKINRSRNMVIMKIY